MVKFKRMMRLFPSQSAKSVYEQNLSMHGEDMTIELWMLVAVSIYGAGQFLLRGRIGRLAQIHRNFMETYLIVASSLLILYALDGFGEWSTKGAVVYAAGRALYLVFSFGPLLPLRKWTWAISIVGLVGCVAQLVKMLLGLVL